MGTGWKVAQFYKVAWKPEGKYGGRRTWEGEGILHVHTCIYKNLTLGMKAWVEWGGGPISLKVRMMAWGEWGGGGGWRGPTFNLMWEWRPGEWGRTGGHIYLKLEVGINVWGEWGRGRKGFPTFNLTWEWRLQWKAWVEWLCVCVWGGGGVLFNWMWKWMPDGKWGGGEWEKSGSYI